MWCAFVNNRYLKHPIMCLSIFLGFILLSTKLYAQNLPSAKFEDSFKIGNDTFVIKVIKSFVTLAAGYGEKIEFSIYKNNKFIHAHDYHGGTLLGCRQPFTTPQEVNPIHKLQVASGVRGWWLITGETCGSRSTKLYAAILPPLKPGQTSYITKIISSNYMGVFARQAIDNNGIEAWAYNYCATCKPSSGSATPMYPKYYVLEGNAQMPVNSAHWPKLADFSKELADQSIYPVGFNALFITGLANKNPALLKQAINAYEQPSANLANESYTADFLPHSRKDLQEIVQAYEVLEKAKLLDLDTP